MSELVFKYGTMSSGKSLHLLSTAHQFKVNGIKYQLLKSSIDNRSENTISSRIGVEEQCTVVNVNENITEKIDRNIKWLLVDEAQFLTPHQVDELSYIVDEWNINVICYGLRTDYLTHLFEGSRRLFEIADRFEELPSYCECGNKNSINAKIDKNGDLNIEDGEQIEIGGDEKYKSICRHCYNKEVIKLTKEIK